MIVDSRSHHTVNLPRVQVPSERVIMSDEVKALARDFGVTVFFKQRQGILRPLALVKGTRKRSSVVEQAAEQLRAMLTESETPTPLEHYTLQVKKRPVLTLT